MPRKLTTEIFIERAIDEQIEVYGDYWHANPEVYNESDLFKTYDGELTAAEIWSRDKERKKHIEGFGFRVIEVWGVGSRTDFTQDSRDFKNFK